MIFAYKLNSLCKNLHPDIQYIACYSPDLKCSFDKFYLGIHPTEFCMSSFISRNLDVSFPLLFYLVQLFLRKGNDLSELPWQMVFSKVLRIKIYVAVYLYL